MPKMPPMMTPLLSVVIPARNERWLARTVQDVLANARGETEVIAICDASWPDPPLQDHPRLTVVHYTEAIGQRAATNQGIRLSRAKYVMKVDGHTAVDEGFDIKLATPYEDGRLRWDCTTIPRLYNLYVYDWECQGCHWKTYQGAKPDACPTCKGTNFVMAEVWKPRMDRRTDYARFDSNLHFQYWAKYEREHRDEQRKEISDVMSSVGACFFMRRDWFRKFGCLDEQTGFWGQFGTEVSCRSWLGGGRQVVNKTTWYSHYFRVNGAGFPYEISGNDQERARQYSQAYWREGKWAGQKRPLSWLVDKFWPIPGWTEEDRAKLTASGWNGRQQAGSAPAGQGVNHGSLGNAQLHAQQHGEPVLHPESDPVADREPHVLGHVHSEPDAEQHGHGERVRDAV